MDAYHPSASVACVDPPPLHPLTPAFRNLHYILPMGACVIGTRSRQAATSFVTHLSRTSFWSTGRTTTSIDPEALARATMAHYTWRFCKCLPCRTSTVCSCTTTWKTTLTVLCPFTTISRAHAKSSGLRGGEATHYDTAPRIQFYPTSMQRPGGRNTHAPILFFCVHPFSPPFPQSSVFTRVSSLVALSSASAT